MVQVKRALAVYLRLADPIHVRLLNATVAEDGGDCLSCTYTDSPVVNDRNPTISTVRFSPIIAPKLRPHPLNTKMYTSHLTTLDNQSNNKLHSSNMLLTSLCTYSYAPQPRGLTTAPNLDSLCASRTCICCRHRRQFAVKLKPYDTALRQILWSFYISNEFYLSALA